MISSLSPLTYFRRNLGKTLPMAFVIVLSVTLVASVTTIIRSIDLTVFTLYGYNRYLTGLTPRNGFYIDEPAGRQNPQTAGTGFAVPDALLHCDGKDHLWQNAVSPFRRGRGRPKPGIAAVRDRAFGGKNAR